MVIRNEQWERGGAGSVSVGVGICMQARVGIAFYNIKNLPINSLYLRININT